MILFIKDVVSELKNLSFPSKKETYITTITIIVAIIIASLTITAFDFVISQIIKTLFGL